MIVSASTWAEWCPPTSQTSNKHHHRRACDYLPLHLQHHSLLQHHLPLWTSTHTHSHVAWYKSPAAARTRKMSNIKHTYCTYTADTPDLLQRLLRPNMWKATCVQAKIPDAFCTRFQAASNETGSASQCSLSETILLLNTADRKPEEKTESNWFPQSPQTFSWQWGLLL